VRDTAALLLRQLMPGLLGLADGGGAAGASSSSDAHAHKPLRTAAAVRASIIAFAQAALRWEHMHAVSVPLPTL
jgi:hypothetical protein